MKNFGVLLLIIGAIWAFVAFNMNTTVSTESQYIGGIHIPSQTVHNIGLMDERRNHLMISALLMVVGVILFAFGSKGTTDNNQATSESKKCPFCAELIKKEALLCRFCGQKFEPSKSIVEQKGIELNVDNYLNAVRDNNKKLVELFINDGIDINSCDKYGITALMLAVEKEYIGIVQILIANKADVNIKTKAGWTALKSAKGKSEIMDLLRNAGAN